MALLNLNHLFLVCLVAFLAGLVDAIAGGGGLIQVPGLLFFFPQIPVINVLGTHKFASCSGTAIASFHYSRALKINYSSFIPTLIAAFIASAIGAKVISSLHSDISKPVIFVLLLVIGIYTLICTSWVNCRF